MTKYRILDGFGIIGSFPGQDQMIRPFVFKFNALGGLATRKAELQNLLEESRYEAPHTALIP